MFVSFVDCSVDFRFCFGHIGKDACHFLYRRNNENMIFFKKKRKKKERKEKKNGHSS